MSDDRTDMVLEINGEEWRFDNIDGATWTLRYDKNKHPYIFSLETNAISIGVLVEDEPGSAPGTDKEKQLLALQERFRVPVCLVPIEEPGCGSYLYYADDRDTGDPDKGLIGYVPEGSEGGYYSECCCSGLTGDPKGYYCKGECHCGACDDHQDDGWQPGLRPGDRG